MTERFPQLAVEDLDDEQQRAIAPILEYTGSISGPFNATLRSARLTETSFTLGTYLLFETGIPRRLTEIAILIGARVTPARSSSGGPTTAGRWRRACPRSSATRCAGGGGRTGSTSRRACSTTSASSSSRRPR